jgi:hypothetical protein
MFDPDAHMPGINRGMVCLGGAASPGFGCEKPKTPLLTKMLTSPRCSEGEQGCVVFVLAFVTRHGFRVIPSGQPLVDCALKVGTKVGVKIQLPLLRVRAPHGECSCLSR